MDPYLVIEPIKSLSVAFAQKTSHGQGLISTSCPLRVENKVGKACTVRSEAQVAAGNRWHSFIHKLRPDSNKLLTILYKSKGAGASNFRELHCVHFISTQTILLIWLLHIHILEQLASIF